MRHTAISSIQQWLKSLLLIVIPLFCIVSCGQGEAKPEVIISNAWIREAPPGTHIQAAYMELESRYAENIELVGVYSEVYDRIEMHDMTQHDGMMQMRKLEQVSIAPGVLVRFEPGGKHLMLMMPNQNLQAGQQVELILEFSSGIKRSALFTVKKPAS